MEPNVLIAWVVVFLVAFGGGQGNNGDYVVPVSDAEVTLLARIIDAEARGEAHLGKVAVGAVVVNRLRDSRFPNTLRDVIYQPRQFHTAELKNRRVPSTASLRAAKAALRGKDPTHGALFFYNPDLAATNTWWESRTAHIRIGNHVFAR